VNEFVIEKVIKEKEKIRTQISKGLEVYRDDKGFLFFDASDRTFNNDLISLDENELEVLLMTIKRSTKILLTTKCLFLLQKSQWTRIEGNEIDDFELMSMLDANPEENDPAIIRAYKIYKLRRQKGYFRILKKDGSFYEIYLPKREFVYGLTDAIKKLQFVTRKYEAI